MCDAERFNMDGDASNGCEFAVAAVVSSVEDRVTSGLNDSWGWALDASAGKTYWTAGKIQRGNLDGTAVEDLATSGLSSPFGLALDATAGRDRGGGLGHLGSQPPLRPCIECHGQEDVLD